MSLQELESQTRNSIKTKYSKKEIENILSNFYKEVNKNFNTNN